MLLKRIILFKLRYGKDKGARHYENFILGQNILHNNTIITREGAQLWHTNP
jgi:hypothetical protein